MSVLNIVTVVSQDASVILALSPGDDLGNRSQKSYDEYIAEAKAIIPPPSA